MGILSSISSVIDGMIGVGRAGPPSYFGSQSTYLAGPLYLDAFQGKRSPSAFELVEQYKSLIYACAQLNYLGVSRVPLRLYSDASQGKKPRDVSGPRSIRRSIYRHLMRAGYLGG